MKKLTRHEQFLLDNTDQTKYTIYRCNKDGLYGLRKDCDNGKCPTCGLVNEPFTGDKKNSKP